MGGHGRPNPKMSPYGYKHKFEKGKYGGFYGGTLNTLSFGWIPLEKHPTKYSEQGIIAGKVCTTAVLLATPTGACKTTATQAPKLIHLTDDTGQLMIHITREIQGKSGIFALPANAASQSRIMRMLRSGISYERTGKFVPIPHAANPLFSRPIPIGPWSGLQYIRGVRIAPPGCINVGTGAFTPTKTLLGPRTLMYGTDAGIYTIGGGGYYWYLNAFGWEYEKYELE